MRLRHRQWSLALCGLLIACKGDEAGASHHKQKRSGSEYLTEAGRVFKSTDGGESWFPSSPNLESSNLESLAIAPSRPGIIYAGGDDFAVYGSWDALIALALWSPTVAETVPGYEVTTWYSFVAPAGTPPEIVTRLNREISAIIESPQIREKLHGQGVEPDAMTPAELGAHLKKEHDKWEKVIKDAKLTPE